MRILMCTDTYWPRVNGVTVSVDSFTHALIRNGNQVLIICSEYPDTPKFERISNTVVIKHPVESPDPKEPVIIRVPSYSAIFSKEDRIAKFHKWFWVEKIIEEFGPELVHVQTEFVIAEFGYYYAKLHDLPVVYTMHTMWEDYIKNYVPVLPEFLLRFISRKYIRRQCNRADEVITPSVQIAEVLKRYKIKHEPHLIPTGVDQSLFKREPDDIIRFRENLVKRFPMLDGKQILLYAGRIGKEKNLSFLLKLFPAVREKVPDVALLIVGNGPELPLFQEEVSELGIAENVFFTGYLDRSDLALVYSVSTVFVFPSRTETQGLVTIEAMLSGLPVVAVGEMGTVAVMGGDNGGFMVPHDADLFTDRVVELLTDPELHASKAAEARDHAASWTIEMMTEKLEYLYRNTITNKKNIK